MANDIDKTSPHYKGEFGSIYEVNQKFPSGGVEGDYVAIDGWAHYWNADRGTWCVNAERDSYWDELMTNIIEKFKLVRGATYMGVASLDTVPAKAIGAKMYYFATVAGTYKNFGDLVVPQGINVLYSENGSSWVNNTLLEVAQELGVSIWKVVSQKVVKEALDLKSDKSVVDAELAKKFDKESVVQESGEAVDKVMSQKAVSDKLNDLVAKNKAQDAIIAGKAEKSDVDASVSELKAKNTSQDAELAKKANAEDVNNSMQELDKKLNRNLLAIEFDDETGDLNAIIGQDSTISSVSTDEDGNVIIEQEII